MGFKLTPATAGKLMAVIAAALVFGCAPPPPSTALKNPTSVFKALSKATSADDANWRCPYEDNVTLKDYIVDGGWDYTGNHSFRVCVNRDNPSKFKISGTTSWTAICMYPMKTGYSQSTGSFSSGVSMVDTPQCYAITGTPIIVTFKDKIDANYMTIVDVNHTNALNDCLSGPSPCPPHAEGFVQ